MDEGQHVGDHLNDRSIAKRTHVENLVAHGFDRRQMGVKEVLVAAGKHGDLSVRGKMHAARHRQLHRSHAMPRRHSSETKNFITAERRHLNPGRSGSQAGK
ncbi:hypothetical protein D9M72_521630 [compost metagenome]